MDQGQVLWSEQSLEAGLAWQHYLQACLWFQGTLISAVLSPKPLSDLDLLL